MSIRVKAKQGEKIIVRYNFPMEKMWFLNMCATHKDKDMKRSPIISVQTEEGKEINLPPPRPMPPMMRGPSGEQIVGMPSGQVFINASPVISPSMPATVNSGEININGSPIIINATENKEVKKNGSEDVHET